MIAARCHPGGNLHPPKSICTDERLTGIMGSSQTLPSTACALGFRRTFNSH